MQRACACGWGWGWGAGRPVTMAPFPQAALGCGTTSRVGSQPTWVRWSSSTARNSSESSTQTKVGFCRGIFRPRSVQPAPLAFLGDRHPRHRCFSGRCFPSQSSRAGDAVTDPRAHRATDVASWAPQCGPSPTQLGGPRAGHSPLCPHPTPASQSEVCQRGAWRGDCGKPRRRCRRKCLSTTGLVFMVSGECQLMLFPFSLTQRPSEALGGLDTRPSPASTLARPLRCGPRAPDPHTCSADPCVC